MSTEPSQPSCLNCDDTGIHLVEKAPCDLCKRAPSQPPKTCVHHAEIGSGCVYCREEMQRLQSEFRSCGENVMARCDIDTCYCRMRIERDKLRAILCLVDRASFDHGCDLEGWDSSCHECQAVKAIRSYMEAKNA